MNPWALSPSTEEGEPRSTATNQKKNVLKGKIYSAAHIPSELQFHFHQLGFGRATIAVGVMWKDNMHVQECKFAFAKCDLMMTIRYFFYRFISQQDSLYDVIANGGLCKNSN